MEFSSPWKKALHGVKHGFMVLGENDENRMEKRRNALRQSAFVNEGSDKNGAGIALTPSTEPFGLLCSQGGHLCADCCSIAGHAPIIIPQEIIPALINASTGDMRTGHAPFGKSRLSEHSGDLD